MLSLHHWWVSLLLTNLIKCVKIHLHMVYISSQYPLILPSIPVYNISIILLIIHQNPSSDFGPTLAQSMDTHVLGDFKLSSGSRSHLSTYSFANLFSLSYLPLLRFLCPNFIYVDSWTFPISYWLQFDTFNTAINLQIPNLPMCFLLLPPAIMTLSLNVQLHLELGKCQYTPGGTHVDFLSAP